MKSKSTKHALLASVLSMMLCCAMLVGTTFAWFTDSVTSGANKITAGNLSVEMKYSTDGTAWATVDENTNMFKEDALWEPGYTEIVYLQVKNAGSLALKYRLGINVVSISLGKTADGKDINLSDFIKFGVIDSVEAPFSADAAGRADARGAVAETAKLVSAGYSSDEHFLEKNTASDMLALVVYMPEDVGNEANYGAGKAQPSIDLGISLAATQYTSETDSFDNQYDKDAEYPEIGAPDTKWFENAAEGTDTYELSTAAELAGFAKLVNGGERFKDKTVILKNNIVLDSTKDWVPIGNFASDNPFMGTFDGGGNTVFNMHISRNHVESVEIDDGCGVGFFGEVINATVKNLTVKGEIEVYSEPVTDENGNRVNGYFCAGIAAWSGGHTSFENCVSYVNIDASKNNTEIMAAGIIACSALNDGGGGNKVTITNCKNYGDIICNHDGSVGMAVAAGISCTDDYHFDISGCENFGKVIAYGEDPWYGDISTDLF